MKRRSLVFNELSISQDNETNLASRIEDALKYMEEFVQILKEADKRNFNLRVPEGFRHLWIYKNFTIHEWLFDETLKINYELQEFFQQFFEQALNVLEPFEKNISQKLYAKIADGFISDYEGVEAQGLGYAFLLKTMAISLDSSKWDKKTITIELFYNDIVSKESVRHISTLSHLDEYHPLRIFEYNPKHPSKGDERYIAIMDLSFDEATDTLLNGVMIEGTNRIFGYFNHNFYVFPKHLGNTYHGYKVKEFPQDIRKKVLQALRDEEIIDETIYNQHIK